MDGWLGGGGGGGVVLVMLRRPKLRHFCTHCFCLSLCSTKFGIQEVTGLNFGEGTYCVSTCAPSDNYGIVT